MKQKTEVANRFLEYEKYAERQIGPKIGILRMDRGGKYLLGSPSKCFKHRSIVHELTTAYTPNQKGKSKRFIRTCMNMVSWKLDNKTVLKDFWGQSFVNSSPCPK